MLKTGSLKQTRLTCEDGRFPIVLQKCTKHHKQGMSRRKRLQVGGRLITDYKLSIRPPLQQVLRFFGGGEFSQGSLSKLQPPAVKPIHAVEVDGPLDVGLVEAHEGPHVQDDEGGRAS